MSDQANDVLVVEGMNCRLGAAGSVVHILSDISFRLQKGRTLGIVGESGAGKSMLIKVITGIAPRNMRTTGQMKLDGQDLSKLTLRQRAALIGRQVGIVFQNPMTSLNPFVRVGRQVEEASRVHLGLSRETARERAIELLSVVGIADPEDCYSYYPHQFSGGMKQRIMIAAALACEPRLLIADEATTALDVTVQKEVLDLLQRIQQARQMSMILVSHNLGVVAGRTDDVMVLYGGRVVEYGPTAEVFRNPRHRYTEALLASIPNMNQPAHSRMRTIPGQPPSLKHRPRGCPFAPRCTSTGTPCVETMPPVTAGIDPRHEFACYFPLDARTSTPVAEAAHAH